MARNTQERSAKAAEKRAKFDEKELRHRVRPGLNMMLADLMIWNNVKEISEAVSLLVINAHAKGPLGSSESMMVPRHKITISENVARKLSEFVAAQEDD